MATLKKTQIAPEIITFVLNFTQLMSIEIPIQYHLDDSEHETNVLSTRHQRCNTGPRSAVGNVSGYRCVSDCHSRGREFDPGPVPYFRGD